MNDFEHLDCLRVGLLADTHGALDVRVQEVIAGCDLAVHAGDIGPAAVLGLLQPRLGRVLAVRGNNDTGRHLAPADRELLGCLPQSLVQPLPGGTLAVIHGHQTRAAERHQRLRARFPQTRAICYGHSHRLVLDHGATPWVLNPGAAGRVRTCGGPSCIVLTASREQWHAEPYRFEQVATARRLRGLAAG